MNDLKSHHDFSEFSVSSLSKVKKIQKKRDDLLYLLIRILWTVKSLTRGTVVMF